MTPPFSPEVVDAVLRHMNTDHSADNVLIVRAFADAAAESARMTGLDDTAGTWSYTSPAGTSTATIAWTVPVTERAGIRRAVVALYDAACEKLGLPPRAH